VIFKAIGNFIFQTVVFGTIFGTHDQLEARTEFLAALPQRDFVVFSPQRTLRYRFPPIGTSRGS
jgi:hypothetical protein